MIENKSRFGLVAGALVFAAGLSACTPPPPVTRTVTTETTTTVPPPPVATITTVEETKVPEARVVHRAVPPRAARVRHPAAEDVMEETTTTYAPVPVTTTKRTTVQSTTVR